MTRALLLLVLMAGCTSTTSPPPSTAVRIPEAKGEVDPATPPPAVRQEPLVDPLDYFVGSWSGRVNGTIDTLLEVSADGHYRVTSEDSSRQAGCELSGRFSVDGDTLHLQVAHSSCSVESIGSTLERTITSRNERNFVVVSPDRSLTVLYRRRAPDG
ncbi:MAG: hypothetical protein KC776_13925 [Myxococcales bacterium]|nr:hypothetical protein [Myxococcales bacterium]MCB9575960.1 hypothetical protein [Polyangiaceae bacterium]